MPKPLLFRKVLSKARRFPHAKDGVTAVEFAIVAAPFFALMFAILQTGLVFFGQQTLETGVALAAREIRTGQAQAQGLTPTQFKDLICSHVSAFFDCSKISLDVRTYQTFDSIDLNNPIDANGNLDTKDFTYQPGHGSDIVVVRGFYEYPLAVGFLGLSNMADGGHLLAAAAAFRNEPFPW